MAVEPWLVGEDLTAVTITPLAKATSGALTSGSPSVLTDTILEVDPQHEVELEDIRPVNTFQRNMVPTGQGTSLRLVALQRRDANVLTTLGSAYRYFQVDWIQGGEVMSFRGTTRRQTPGGVRSRGANPIYLELEPIAEGDTPNLTFAT